MGLDLGKLLKNVGTLGGSFIRDQRQAKKKKKKAGQLVEANTATAQQMFDRDLGQTAFTGMQADPALLASQQRALGQTEQVAREGYTDVDRQAMQQQLGEAARYEQAQRATLADQARARGVSGSGVDIAAQLAAQQAGADRATGVASDMALAGRERTYNANQDAAQLAGAMRSQGFGEQAQGAAASDQYRQWQAGQQSADAAALANARLGQAQALNTAAAQQAATPNLDAAGNAIASYYAAGLSSGGAPSSAAAPSGFSAGGGGGAPSHEGTSHARTAAPRAPAPGGQAQALASRVAPPRVGGMGNARLAARGLMRPRTFAPTAPTPAAAVASTNPYRRGVRG